MKKWATTATAMGLALTASLGSTSASPTKLFKLRQTMMATERNHIQFNEYEVKPEAHYLLGERAMAEASEWIPCTTTKNTSTINSGNATILIAISKCVNSDTLKLINDWIESTKTARAAYVDAEGNTKNLTFTTTFLPGDCEVRSDRANRGYNDTSGYQSQTLLSDGTDYAQYADVLPEEVERIQAFARFGRVLPAVADYVASDAKQVPVAVVSFVNNNRSYNYIEQYESKYKISKTFNFKMCQNGTACGGNFENCITLDEDIDLFMYNPFVVVHSTQCTDLEGGIPVTYLDANHAHQCYCKCPAGYKMDAYKAACTPIESDTCDCVWKQSSPSLRIDNTNNLGTCLFGNLSSCWHMAVPFPLDNYVSDYRNNSRDGLGNLANGPHVDLIVTRLNGTVFNANALEEAYEKSHPGEKLVITNIVETATDDMLDMVVHNDASAEKPTSEDYVSKGGPQGEIYEWKDYQKNRGAKIDSIELHTYGKFQLELKASDYSSSATCLGCVEVVDKFRPKNTTQCPLRVCDNSTSLCSSSHAGVVEAVASQYAKLDELVAAVYTFRNNATNDACGSVRCDEKTLQVKSWLEDSYTDSDFDSGDKCLSQLVLESTFKDSLDAKQNPLKSGNAAKAVDTPVDAFKCKRCCKYGVRLQEWWVDYKCGYDYDVKHCEGDAPRCDFEQCVALNGDTLATATASIKTNIKTESDNVLASLSVEGFQSYTQVHRALPCTDFSDTDSTCSYSVSVDALFDKSASLKFASGNADEYVFWRYKIHDEHPVWKLWESATAYSFTKPATQITIEAWTACGRVRQFYFYVHLHTHSDIKVCEYFKSMWYQSTVARLDASETTALCAYPGSDFAELTFDYQANIGLKYAYDRLRMNVTGVQCNLAFTDKTPAQILNVTGTSMDVIERYAVELQNLARTQKDTSFAVNCTFTYMRYGGSTLTRSCDRAFTITDCDAPTIDTPDAECSWDDCAGQGKPGPYEVCSGNVVASTVTATYLNTAETECCQGCAKTESARETVCTSILDLPVGRDIKRCVPPTTRGVYGEYGYDSYGDSTYTSDAYISSTPALLAKAAASHPTAAAATVLLVASALVALVALVVVRRRRAAAAEAMIVEDAYYPLLH